MGVLGLPFLLMPARYASKLGSLWGHCVHLCLSTIPIGFSFKGDIAKSDQVIYAVKHQSAWETLILYWQFDSPIVVLKKELLSIPLFGWYLRKIGSISINRDKITKDNLGFFEDVLEIISNSNRPLIIFPQARRVLPTERPSFKKGVAKIYDKLSIKCQPLAINSGFVWPKKGKKESNKKITVSILEPISPGLSKEDFVMKLENKIYSELDKIN